MPQLGNYDFDSLTSEQLDDLFFKNDNVAYGVLRVFFTDARLAKSTFDGLKFGQYKAFGKAIGGSWTYGGFFEDRVNHILKAISKEKVGTKSIPFYKTTWFWIAVLVIFAVILWLYRDLVIKSYKTIL